MNLLLDMFPEEQVSQILVVLPVFRFNRHIFIRRQDLDKLIFDSVAVSPRRGK